MAELQFSGSRRDLAVEKGWVQLLRWFGEHVYACASDWWGGRGGRRGRKKKTEKRGRKNGALSLKMNDKMGNPRVTA